MNLGERELVALNSLKSLSRFNFVLIGGYAINVYVPPRFSVDCDLVVLGNLKEIISTLAQEDYKLTEKGAAREEYMRYVKEDEKVSFDLLIGTVFDRLTQTSFERELFEKYSSRRTLVGKANNMRIEVTVADPELLFTMKFTTSRKQDIRDVFMLSSYALDFDRTKSIITSKCNAALIKARTRLIRDTINSADYRKSLEGAYGGIPDQLFRTCTERLFRFLEGLEA